MSKILWGQSDRLLEYGVDHGVLYIDGPGIPWESITGIIENASDVEVSSYYFDGVKMIDSVGDEDFGLQIAAYFCPEEFEDYRGLFGFSYRTGSSTSAKIHLVYNATSAPSGKAWTTKSDKVSPSDFVWDISTVPVKISGIKPTAHLVIDVSNAHPDIVDTLNDILYGTEATDPHLPTPEEIIEIFSAYATLVIINHGDGTWTAIGPDDVVYMLNDTTFEIDWPSVIYVTPDKYNVSSL